MCINNNSKDGLAILFLPMKKLVILFCILGFNLYGFSQSVDKETAQKVATNYFQSISNQMATIANIDSKTDRYGKVIYYAVNFQPAGFVLVAADERANPILAYSTQNEFVIGKVPSTEVFTEAYEKNIADIQSKKKTSDTYSKQWADLKQGKFRKESNNEAPLLTSLWNQSKYYNWLCPDDSTTSAYYDYKVPCGCVALAMAQIMYYYRYPRMGTGTKAYMSKNGYGLIRANFDTTVYDYESMSDVAYNYSDALARLIFHCGVSVEMRYDAEGSGAFSGDVATALTSFFSYKYGFITSKIGYSDEEWLARIKTDIDAGCPIYYSGSSTTGGHAFVCDGYNNEGYVHINFGWGGAGNGYYSFSSMGGYNNNQQAIFGLKPSCDTSNFFSGTKTLTATYGSFNDGSNYLNYNNNSSCSWLICPGENTSAITLNIARFSTEIGNDVVNIYAGKSADGILVKSISGDTIAPETSIIINDSCAFITFTSNDSIVSTGFTFSYTSTKTSNNYCSTSVNPTRLTEDHGRIDNGSEGNGYDKSNICYWSIAPASASDSFGIIFRKFDLAQGDMIEIMRQGKAQGATLNYAKNRQFRFSLDKKPTLDSVYRVKSSAAYIKFISDNNLSNTGWEIEWVCDLSINDIESGCSNLSIYPNPATDILHIDMETQASSIIDIDIYDMMGKCLYHQQHNSSSVHTDIDVSRLAKGVYLVKLQTEKGMISRKINIF